MLGPNLVATGIPGLEVLGVMLVYAFPVTEVAGLSVVYMDAATGQYCGMDYHFPGR
ncbi:MAG: hypothetical protein AB1445_04030 [Bacillota bacterium]